MSDVKSADRLAILRKRVAKTAQEPGVYRWLDAQGNVLYVGKAKNLRNRMQTYVQEGPKRSAWTEIMVRQIADFDVTVVNSELEALMLETNLIKELRPKYNIMMKDDKNYVYARVSVQDPYPRIDIVRKMEKDGALYFGPKTSAEEVRGTLSFLRTLFPFRNCKMQIEPGKIVSAEQKIKVPAIALEVTCHDRDRPTPCVDHHIKQCIAPCIGAVTPEEYRLQAIDGVVAYFQGKYQDAEKILEDRMKQAAAEKKFERAAKFRDQLTQMRSMREKQLVADVSMANSDTVGAALLSGHAYIVLLRERDGKMISEESFSLQGTADSLGEVLGQFLPQYYLSASDLPDSIVLGEEPADRTSIEAMLADLRGKRIRLVIPERGKKSKILKLAEKNADWKARQNEAKWESEIRKTEESLGELQKLLGMTEMPKRIEGYDISHLGGTATVGSMVVFCNGKPKREHYRSFNMQSVKEGDIDDYKSLAESLRRRLKYLTHSPKKEEILWNEKGLAFGKARKAEQKTLEEISAAHPDDIGSDGIDYGDYLVARKEEEIVAFCRLFTYPGVVVTLRSVWVQDAWRRAKLGQFLVKKILQRVTKGKVYVHVSKDSLLEYYGELGFVPVNTPPAPLQQKLADWEKAHPGASPGSIMVYLVSKQKIDESFASLPDLLLIDGGKGQLSAAVAVLKEAGLMIPVAGLAKREEEIFLPGQSFPLIVPDGSSARFLLQRVRDEAHRFANHKREGRLGSTLFQSALDDIPGVGETTRAALLKKFGSVDGVQAATDGELLGVLNASQLTALRKQFPGKVS